MIRQINVRKLFADHLIVTCLLFAILYQIIDIILNYFMTTHLHGGLVNYYKSPYGHQDIWCFFVVMSIFVLFGIMCRSIILEVITETNEKERLLTRNKQFAYSVIHDIKNPAIGIHTMAMMLKKTYSEHLDDKGKHYFDILEQVSRDIISLMEKIYEFIQSGEHPLDIETVNIHDELTIIRRNIESISTMRDIRWLQQPVLFPEIKADRLSISRIFRNLIDNALKHGGDDLSQLKVEYHESDGFHEFSIGDNGCGIDEFVQKTVFEVFKSGKTSGNVDGLGLGLTTVKNLVEKHGGSIWMNSVLGNGTTFTFTISKNL
jgi:signal transduction histidine kinase